jgi:hypothetical protein
LIRLESEESRGDGVGEELVTGRIGVNGAGGMVAGSVSCGMETQVFTQCPFDG